MLAHIIPSMTPIGSPDFGEIGYMNSNLFINFRQGFAFKYFRVPQAEYEALLTADNPEEHFQKHIKGRYETIRIA